MKKSVIINSFYFVTFIVLFSCTNNINTSKVTRDSSPTVVDDIDSIWMNNSDMIKLSKLYHNNMLKYSISIKSDSGVRSYTITYNLIIDSDTIQPDDIVLRTKSRLSDAFSQEKSMLGLFYVEFGKSSTIAQYCLEYDKKDCYLRSIYIYDSSHVCKYILNKPIDDISKSLIDSIVNNNISNKDCSILMSINNRFEHL